jgi:hypothetical protein
MPPFQRRRFSVTGTNWAETALSLSIGVLVPLAVGAAAGLPLAAQKKHGQAARIERGRDLAAAQPQRGPRAQGSTGRDRRDLRRHQAALPRGEGAPRQGGEALSGNILKEPSRPGEEFA